MKRTLVIFAVLLLLAALQSCEVVRPQKCTTLEEANVENQMTRQEKKELEYSRKRHFKSQSRNTRRMMKKSPRRYRNSYF